MEATRTQTWVCQECGETYSVTQRICINCTSGGRFIAKGRVCPPELRKEVDEDLQICRMLKQAVEKGHPIRKTLGDPHRGLLLKLLPKLLAGESIWTD